MDSQWEFAVWCWELKSRNLFSMSVSPLLPWPYVHRYHLSRFHVYVLVYDVCFSLADVLHSLWPALVVGRRVVRTDEPAGHSCVCSCLLVTLGGWPLSASVSSLVRGEITLSRPGGAVGTLRVKGGKECERSAYFLAQTQCPWPTGAVSMNVVTGRVTSRSSDMQLQAAIWWVLLEKTFETERTFPPPVTKTVSEQEDGLCHF